MQHAKNLRIRKMLPTKRNAVATNAKVSPFLTLSKMEPIRHWKLSRSATMVKSAGDYKPENGSPPSVPAITFAARPQRIDRILIIS